MQIWCEGKTEEDYFNSLFKHLNYDNIKIDIKNLKNKNSYKSILYKIEKELYIDKLIVAMDLDRIKRDANELEILKKLINYIKKSKDKHLFLTLDNFEDWLRFHFTDNTKNSKASFYKKLGYSDTKNFKLNTKNLYHQISSKDGNIENAEKYFSNIEVFCNEEYNINKHSLNNKIQSNLYYFRKVIEKYNNS